MSNLTFKTTRIHTNTGDSSIKAFVDVSVNDGLLVKNIKVVNGPKDLFVSMPQEKGKDGKWYDTVHPLTKENREALEKVVMEAYKASLEG